MSVFLPLRASPFFRTATEIMKEMERLEPLCVQHMGNVVQPTSQTESAKEVVNNAQKFAITLDVSKYRPEDLKISLDGSIMTVEGNFEQDNEGSYVKRSFVRRWTLPEDVRIEDFKSELSDNGELIIEAPKIQQLNGKRTIPIEFQKKD